MKEAFNTLGGKLNASNHRPISVMSVFPKVFEITRMIEYLNRYRILFTKQYGFRKAGSMQNAIA